LRFDSPPRIRTSKPQTCTGLQAGCVDKLVAEQVGLRACTAVEEERGRLLEMAR
jgi:hypothetical protein